MPRVWEILKRFKELCKCRGWTTCENEDWVEIDSDYHNFLFARNIHLSSFKRIVTSRKCVVPEGLSYHVVDASYTAWIFSETPSENLIGTVLENPDFESRNAVYDLSPLFKGKNLCIRLNNTDSPVFHEFENFLKNELKVEFKPPSSIPGQVTTGSCATSELA